MDIFYEALRLLHLDRIDDIDLHKSSIIVCMQCRQTHLVVDIYIWRVYYSNIDCICKYSRYNYSLMLMFLGRFIMMHTWLDISGLICMLNVCTVYQTLRVAVNNVV